MRKERFLNQGKSKLQVRGDNPFQICGRINNKDYELDLPNDFVAIIASMLLIFSL